MEGVKRKNSNRAHPRIIYHTDLELQTSTVFYSIHDSSRKRVVVVSFLPIIVNRKVSDFGTRFSISEQGRDISMKLAIPDAGYTACILIVA